MVLGWVVFHTFAQKRDQKSRYLSKIDDAINRVEEIEKAALQFWSSPGSEVNQQECQLRSMIMMIDHLENRMSMLGNTNINFDSEVNDLSRSILDGNGESLDRSALSITDNRFIRISNATRKLKEKLCSIE